MRDFKEKFSWRDDSQISRAGACFVPAESQKHFSLEPLGTFVGCDTSLPMWREAQLVLSQTVTTGQCAESGKKIPNVLTSNRSLPCA
jgi:hypothetical protein